ncbi:MAG: hypothetical protein Q9167_007652 [Letrouitia subvulpina]
MGMVAFICRSDSVDPIPTAHPPPHCVYAHIHLDLAWHTLNPRKMLINLEHTKLPHHSIPTTGTKTLSSNELIISPSVKSASETAPQHILKRARPEGDVDGEGSENLQRKKRRLQFNLVTSRLSKPYAAPATHIISRRVSRKGIWLKEKIPRRGLLLHAAILNSVRVRKNKTLGSECHKIEVPATLKSEENANAMDLDMLPEAMRIPRPVTPGLDGRLASPVGEPWNYDAYDHEDEDLYDEDADESADGEEIHSNFNDLATEEENIEDYDTLSPFSGEVD